MTHDTPSPGVSDESTALEPADTSGVPTPRALSWNNNHLTTLEALPVVTAKSEPTQRGLGIPPPPSSSEPSWDDRVTSITSLSPLSVDAFEKSPEAPPSESSAPTADSTGAENERITVRAPPPVASSRGRRRAMGATLAAAAVLLLCLFVRRATLEPQGVSAAEKKPAATLAAVPPPGVAEPASTGSPAVQAPPEPLPSSSGSPAPTEATPEPSSQQPGKAPRADKRSRARNASAEPSSGLGNGMSLPERGLTPEPAQNRSGFSLPPR